MVLGNKKIDVPLSFLILVMLAGCSIPDRDTEVDSCIAQKKGIKSQIIQACRADPIFTDCAMTESSQIIGSGCTKKYEGKSEAESEKICISSVAKIDFDLERSIVRSCLKDNSEDSIELRTVFAYVTNFVLVAGLLGFLFPIYIAVFDGESSGSRPRRGSSQVTVSSTRKELDNEYTKTIRNPKDTYVESGRFDWILLNCRDIKKRQHICKGDYQLYFRELGMYYGKHHVSFNKKIQKDEVVDLLTWAISVIPSVYTGKSEKQGQNRRASLEKFIAAIEPL